MLEKNTATIFQVTAAQQTSSQENIEVAVVIEIGDQRTWIVTGQIDFVLRRLLDKRPIAAIDQ